MLGQFSGKPGEQHDWQSWKIAPDYRRERRAIYAWHMVVNDDSVNSVSPKNTQCAVGIGCGQNGVAPSLEHELANEQTVFMVINAQDRAGHAEPVSTRVVLGTTEIVP